MTTIGMTTAPQVGEMVLVSVEDALHSRLIESAAVQLGLRPLMVEPDDLLESPLAMDAAIVVADERIAREVRQTGAFSPASVNGIPPALVAVLSPEQGKAPQLPIRNDELPYNGVLVLPQPPAGIVAQLSVTLYAHRTYIERLETAMELQLDRRIFRSVTSGVSVASATEIDFPLVYVNPAFEVMTGYSLEEIQGKNCRFLQGKDHDQPGLTLIREALKDERETLAIIRNYRKDGSPFWNELSLSPIRDQAGTVTHFVGIQNDVTSRVAYEDALRESEKVAALGRLAASIAHEINNPLATVTNLIYLARHERQEEQRDAFLDLAAEELNRATLLTTQSLTFYRQSTNPTTVDPGNLISEVTDVYSVKLKSLKISLKRRDRSCNPIACMESEIRQVVSNLLRNAMEAQEGKSGRILLRVREGKNQPHGTRGVFITVADTGTGMSAATKSRIYSAFYTTKQESGTGLGLWVSKGIVDRHHGTIHVRSRQAEPSGTVFRLFLPYDNVVANKPVNADRYEKAGRTQ